jgi:vacuolar protein sorting-associated protein 13A/C
LSSSLGSQLAKLSADDDFQKQRIESNKSKPTSTISGVRAGLNEFGNGIFAGVTGLITQPIKAAEKDESVSGLMKGVGKGLLGLVVRPVTGNKQIYMKMKYFNKLHFVSNIYTPHI